MKLKRLAEETDGYNTEGMTTFKPEYVTEAKEEATLYAMELVCSAAMQSGLKFLKTIIDEEKGYERIFFNAKDAEPAVIQNIVKDLERHADYNYEFGSEKGSHDVLAISYKYKDKDDDNAE